MERALQWWSEVELPEGQTRHWRLGPLSMWMTRGALEWRLVHTYGADPVDTSLIIGAPPPPQPPDDPARTHRFGTGGRGTSLKLEPRLADRPVVVKPESPFTVMPSDSVDLYLTTPCWVSLSADGRELTKLPSLRPTDTWLGPPTESGGLCYATLTRARLSAEDLSAAPHRAVTRLTVNNQGGDPLRLERVRVPLPDLGLYASDTGRLWTEGLTMTRSASDQVEVRVDDAPSAGSATFTQLFAGSRSGGNVLVRALGALFG